MKVVKRILKSKMNLPRAELSAPHICHGDCHLAMTVVRHHWVVIVGQCLIVPSPSFPWFFVAKRSKLPLWSGRAPTCTETQIGRTPKGSYSSPRRRSRQPPSQNPSQTLLFLYRKRIAGPLLRTLLRTLPPELFPEPSQCTQTEKQSDPKMSQSDSGRLTVSDLKLTKRWLWGGGCSSHSWVTWVHSGVGTRSHFWVTFGSLQFFLWFCVVRSRSTSQNYQGLSVLGERTSSKSLEKRKHQINQGLSSLSIY